MPHSKATKYLVPGVFLLTLGLGNIVVGQYKSSQYQEILAEISAQDEIRNQVTAEITSSFRRLKMSSPAQEKLNQKIKSSKQRLSFYQLVKLGGVFFIMLSCIFLALAHIVYQRQLQALKNYSETLSLPKEGKCL